MSGGELHEISVAIGELRGEVKSLGEKIDRNDRNAVDSTKRADEHRTVIHRRVDDLVETVGIIATKVEVMEPAVSDSKKVTDEFKEWKQRGIGALFVAGIAGTALGGTAVGFIVYWWDSLMKLLRSA